MAPTSSTQRLLLSKLTATAARPRPHARAPRHPPLASRKPSSEGAIASSPVVKSPLRDTRLIGRHLQALNEGLLAPQNDDLAAGCVPEESVSGALLVVGPQPACRLQKLSGPPVLNSWDWPCLPPKRPSSRCITSCTPVTRRAHSSAPTSASPVATIPVEFRVQFHTRLGQDIHLVGSSPHLGEWSVAHACPLKWTAGGVWTTTVQLPAGGATAHVLCSGCSSAH